MHVPISKQVRRRIQKKADGSIFVVRDFLDLAGQDTITRILSRLAYEGTIHRIEHGVYHVPRISTLVGKPVPPEPAQVAAALARRTGGRIMPSEAHAANALGLTTQVPAKNVYYTNAGKTRRVDVGNQTIELRRAETRRFPERGQEKAASVIQALRFVGEGNVTTEIVAKLRRELSSSDKVGLSARLADSPAWMHSYLRAIARKDGDVV